MRLNLKSSKNLRNSCFVMFTKYVFVVVVVVVVVV